MRKTLLQFAGFFSALFLWWAIYDNLSQLSMLLVGTILKLDLQGHLGKSLYFTPRFKTKINWDFYWHCGIGYSIGWISFQLANLDEYYPGWR